MSFAFKLVIVVLCLFVVGVLAMTAGAVYVGYVAKKRVAAVKEAIKHDDVGGVIAAAKGDTPSKPQPLPDWKPASPDLVSSAAGEIPLRKSLRWVEVGNDPLLGDFESIFTVGALNSDSLHVNGEQQFPKGQGFERFFGAQNNHSKLLDNVPLNKIMCGRTIFMKDLDSSAEMDGYFCRQRTTVQDGSDAITSGFEEKHPGTTAMGFSKKTLQELRATGQSEFTFHEDPLNSVFSSFKNALTAPDDQASQDKAASDLMQKMMNFAPAITDAPMETPAIKCTLHRAGPDLAFPVLVNDQPTELPAMDVVCKNVASDKQAHLYVLDDPDNPLLLATASHSARGGQIVKIYWDFPKRTGIEEELANNDCAKVYDLHFDFRRDVLRPGSDGAQRDSPGLAGPS